MTANVRIFSVEELRHLHSVQPHRIMLNIKFYLNFNRLIGLVENYLPSSPFRFLYFVVHSLNFNMRIYD